MLFPLRLVLTRQQVVALQCRVWQAAMSQGILEQPRCSSKMMEGQVSSVHHLCLVAAVPQAAPAMAQHMVQQVGLIPVRDEILPVVLQACHIAYAQPMLAGRA